MVKTRSAISNTNFSEKEPLSVAGKADEGATERNHLKVERNCSVQSVSNGLANCNVTNNDLLMTVLQRNQKYVRISSERRQLHANKFHREDANGISALRHRAPGNCKRSKEVMNDPDKRPPTKNIKKDPNCFRCGKLLRVASDCDEAQMTITCAKDNSQGYRKRQCKRKITEEDKNVKTCFVLLERLDNELLNRHLYREEITLKTSTNCRHTEKERQKRERGHFHLIKSYSKVHRDHKVGIESRNAQGSVSKSDLIKRKRKIRIKPLQYTDDEDELHHLNPEKNILEKTRGGRLHASLNESQNWKKNSGAEIENSDHGTSIKSSEKNVKLNDMEKPRENEKNRVTSENIYEHSSYKNAQEKKGLKPNILNSKVLSLKNSSEKMNCIISINNVFNGDEVKIVEESGKCSGSDTKVNRDKKSNISKESGGAFIQKQEFGNEEEDEDDDLRDEDEDDRATVVFEKNFGDGLMNFEDVSEVAEQKIVSVKKKFKRKKIMNRKKRKLVKFKRKRCMIGKNLPRVKKGKKRKCSEVDGTSQQTSEKGIESVSERYMKEVCSLVKRFHELYVIILQLQKNLPMDSEKADHFIRAINAEENALYKKIRKSRKTIVKGYDKMLNWFGNASTVSNEISKRASMSKEDVDNVISRCALLGGLEEKTKGAGTEENEVNSSQESPLKTFGMGGHPKKFMKPTNDRVETSSADSIQKAKSPQLVQMEPSCNIFKQPNTNSSADLISHPPKQTLHTSANPHPAKPLKRCSNEPMMAKMTGGENQSVTHFLHLPFGPIFSTSLPPRANFQGQLLDSSKQRPHFCAQKNHTHRTQALRDLRFRQFPQHDTRGDHPRSFSSRPVHSQSSVIGPQYGANSFLSPSGIATAMIYPPRNPSVEFSQICAGYMSPGHPGAERSPGSFIPSLMDINPYPLVFNQERLPMQHLPQVSNSCSLGPGVRPVLLLPKVDKSKPGNMSSESGRSQKNSGCLINRQRVNIFPSSKNCTSNAPSQVFSRDKRSPFETVSTNFAGFSPSNPPIQTHSVMGLPREPQQMHSSLPDPATEATKCANYALDPTVPQKLTMRNCRLTAGPMLKPKDEDSKSKGLEVQRQESSSEDGGCDALNQKVLTSREYVCAQNGCKNPGVRICKGCLSIIYCSETCQLKHWTLKHKAECHQLKELRG